MDIRHWRVWSLKEEKQSRWAILLLKDANWREIPTGKAERGNPSRDRWFPDCEKMELGAWGGQDSVRLQGRTSIKRELQWEISPEIGRGPLSSFNLSNDECISMKKTWWVWRKNQQKRKNSWNLHKAVNRYCFYQPNWHQVQYSEGYLFSRGTEATLD